MAAPEAEIEATDLAVELMHTMRRARGRQFEAQVWLAQVLATFRVEEMEREFAHRRV